MRPLILSLSLVLIVLSRPGMLRGAGMEEFGNSPLSPANYVEWPGLVEVADDDCRVYTSWVNGNEDFYFAGTTEQLNESLKEFAEIKVKTHEVLIRPGPGKAHTFNRERTLDCNWHVNVHGGISKIVTTKDQGDKIWPADPTMEIWIGGSIELDKIKIPEGVTVLGVNEKSARARDGLDSKDQMVRGWGSLVLPDLNAYSAENYAAVEKLLSDSDNWVRLCAAGAIKQFGARAKAALPLLQQCAKSDDEQLKKAAADAIAVIESAKEDDAAAKEHVEAVKKIAEFRSGLKQNP